MSIFFNYIFDGLAGWTGSYVFMCIGIMALIVIGMLLFGLEFDFALLMSAPLPYAFFKGGYIDAWISGIMIVIVLGTAIYMVWIKWSNRY